jgi:hypothetical protein
MRYPLGEYQVVPDGQSGDAGIEGFSLDGCVYQMYGPRNEQSFRSRHEAIRRKITDDTRKFVENGPKLRALLGALKVRRWILLVPAFDSREIVEHAAKRTQYVAAAGLDYVDVSDFRVMVVDEDAFAVERKALLNQGLGSVRIDAEEIGSDVVDAWTVNEANSKLVQVLDAKLARLPTLRNPALRLRVRRHYVSHLLHGQNVLEGLRSYPDIWEAIRRLRSERERYLYTSCITSPEAPGSILRDAIDGFISDVHTCAPALNADTVNAVAHEVIADWLMRCPLDFPEPASNE